MGDCWRHCVARLAGVATIEVPDFVNTAGKDWLQATAQWLWVHGYDLVALVPVLGVLNTELAKCMAPTPPYIAVGQAALTDERHHAVVFDAGGYLWDPEPSGCGLASVVAVYWVVKH